MNEENVLKKIECIEKTVNDILLAVTVLQEDVKHMHKKNNEINARQDNERDSLFRITRGGNGISGHELRIDRLEQVEKERAWSIRVIWGALLSIVSGWIGMKLFGK